MEHSDMPPFSRTHNVQHEWNTHFCMPQGCAVVHHLPCTVQHRGSKQEWDRCLHLNICFVEYCGSENVTPATPVLKC